MLCSTRTSEPAAACPFSYCPGPGGPFLAVAGDTPALALALAATVPRCNLYVFCQVQELFIIYCITAVKIYFAIRGGKEIALACFFSLRLLVLGGVRRGHRGWGWEQGKVCGVSLLEKVAAVGRAL